MLMTMSALPPSQMAALRETFASPAAGHAESGMYAPIDTLCTQWDAVHALAAQVAVMADISPERSDDIVAGFRPLLSGANDWQCNVAARGIEDIEALLRLGLTALATVTTRGQDPGAPALALWREFHHARETVLAVLQPHARAA